VLRDEAEGLLLAAAADHDRDAGPAQRLWGVEQLARGDLAADVSLLSAALTVEHAVGHAQGVLEQLEAVGQRRKAEAEGAGLLGVPGGADAEPGAATAEHVEGRRGLHPQAGRAVMHAAHEEAEARPGGHGREVAERGPALEHRVTRRADAPDLEEVVHDADRVAADLVRVPGDPSQRRPDLGIAAGPRERADLEADL